MEIQISVHHTNLLRIELTEKQLHSIYGKANKNEFRKKKINLTTKGLVIVFFELALTDTNI